MRLSKDRTLGLSIVLVALLVVLGSAGLLAVLVPVGAVGPSPSSSTGTAVVPAAGTHGDLTVVSGETYTIAPPNGTASSFNYYQGGNVTVQAGGTLILRDVNFSFVQAPFNYVFNDAGSVQMYNTSVTTVVQLAGIPAEVPLLSLTVTGQLTAWDSVFAFPGSFVVSGGAAVATLNGSAVTPNPAVAALNEPPIYKANAEWAPTLQVLGGANLNLFGSQVVGIYADNWTANGAPPATSYTPNIFNITVSGTGSKLSAVDTALGINWVLSTNQSRPWYSNKLVFTGGAVGYLANITTPIGFFPRVANATSAVVPDATSQVYLYRWSQFNLTGANSSLYVQGGHVTAFYAYNSNQLNNQTANALNDLATADPAIWAYVQYWDVAHGAGGYGMSNSLGQAAVLLASGNLTGATLPNGYFLGNYHVETSVPAASIPSNWFNWSVSPYPMGVSNGTSHYNQPDFAPTQSFLGYYGALSVQGVNVTANLTASTSVRIGQMLGLEVSTIDAGSAPISSISGFLYYNATNTTPLASFTASGVSLTAPGQSFAFNISWLVNDSVTGLHGTFSHAFAVGVMWNNGDPSAGGGTYMTNVTVTIEPSQVRVVSATTPSSTTINLDQQYYTTVVVAYNGSKAATVWLYAVPTSGGSAILVGTASAHPGAPTSLAWYFPLKSYLAAGGSYHLEVSATYNTVTSSSLTIPGTYHVPSTTTTSKNFFTQTLFGLPFWMWLAIAAAIIIVVAAFLLLARRQAKGKLVECGECGNLIPEDATVCPKCGAEFEKDLVRCSRCASTIPAESKYCPECAAQLLGKPGEGTEEAERQGYADFTEKFRAEGKRELGENFSEGGFWDWWKRQPTYTTYGQWKLQQGQGTPRAGMTVPPAGTVSAPEETGRPPRSGGAARRAPPAPVEAEEPEPPMQSPPPRYAAAAPSQGAQAPGASLKPCPNCGKEIPPDYLVCPFCGAVTQ